MKRTLSVKKVQIPTSTLLCGTMAVMAQDLAGGCSTGTTALATMAEEIAKYVSIMVKLRYATAGVMVIVGTISVYITMSVLVMVA